MKNHKSIAIDGPAGAGKSTLARMTAKYFGLIYVDTGAMYRSIGLYGMRKEIDIKDPVQVEGVLSEINISLAFQEGTQHIYLNNEDVSEKVRAEQAGMAASVVAKQPAVRQFLLELQRDMAEKNNILMDGRDIGTVVLPNATVKIYLTASVEARANRRYKELQEKGNPETFEKVKKDIEERDWQDMNREISPLKKAADAVEVDTSALNLQQSFDVLLDLIRQKANL